MTFDQEHRLAEQLLEAIDEGVDTLPGVIARVRRRAVKLARLRTPSQAAAARWLGVSRQAIHKLRATAPPETA